MVEKQNCVIWIHIFSLYKKVIRLMSERLGGKIRTKFVRLRAKTYSYLTDDDSKDKKG